MDNQGGTGATLAGEKALVAKEASIGQQLIWAPKRAVTGEVSLERTHLHRLDDWRPDRDGAFLPRERKLRLAGFEYDEFGGDNYQNKDNWKQRLQ